MNEYKGRHRGTVSGRTGFQFSRATFSPIHTKRRKKGNEGEMPK